MNPYIPQIDWSLASSWQSAFMDRLIALVAVLIGIYVGALAATWLKKALFG